MKVLQMQQVSLRKSCRWFILPLRQFIWVSPRKFACPISNYLHTFHQDNCWIFLLLTKEYIDILWHNSQIFSNNYHYIWLSIENGGMMKN